MLHKENALDVYLIQNHPLCGIN